MGDVRAKYAGAIIGNENTGRQSFLNNIWYCENDNADIFGYEGNPGAISKSNVELKTAAEIASKEAVTLLGDAWKYDSDYPVLIY